VGPTKSACFIVQERAYRGGIRSGNPPRVSRKAPSPAAAPPPKKVYTVEVFKGNKRTEEKID